MYVRVYINLGGSGECQGGLGVLGRRGAAPGWGGPAAERRCARGGAASDSGGDPGREPVFDRIVAVLMPRIQTLKDGHTLSLLACAFTCRGSGSNTDRGERACRLVRRGSRRRCVPVLWTAPAASPKICLFNMSSVSTHRVVRAGKSVQKGTRQLATGYKH